MYDRQRSDLSKRYQYNIKPATSFPKDGVLATAEDNGSGDPVIVPSGGTASATENVVGFAMLVKENITQDVKYEQVTIPTTAPHTVQLQTSTPVMLGALAEASAVQTDGTVYTQIAIPVATGDFHIGATGLATFFSADAGKVIDIYVRATITLEESIMRYGVSCVNNDFYPLNNCQVACGKGKIYTMEYDVSQAYAIGGLLYTHNTVAEGQVTSDNTSGKVIGKCCQVPDSSTRYLGVEFNI